MEEFVMAGIEIHRTADMLVDSNWYKEVRTMETVTTITVPSLARVFINQIDAAGVRMCRI